MTEQVQEQVEEVEVVAEPQLPAIIPLASQEGDLIQFTDYDLEMTYKRVKDPEDQNTNFWEVFYRDIGKPNWFTVNGLLSKEFTIARTEALVGQLSTTLNAEVLTDRFFRSGTFAKIVFLLSGFEVQNPASVNDTDKLLFQLLTEIDIDEINSNSVLSFYIVNGLAGNSSLYLNYGLFTTFDGGNERQFAINNIFALWNFRTRMVHDSNFEVSYQDVQDVSGNISAQLTALAQIVPDIRFMAEVEDKFPKKYVTAFVNIFDQLPDEHKNLYYVTYIWSYLCKMTQNISLEIRLRKYLESYILSLQTDS